MSKDWWNSFLNRHFETRWLAYDVCAVNDSCTGRSACVWVWTVWMTEDGTTNGSNSTAVSRRMLSRWWCFWESNRTWRDWWIWTHSTNITRLFLTFLLPSWLTSIKSYPEWARCDYRDVPFCFQYSIYYTAILKSEDAIYQLLVDGKIYSSKLLTSR